MTATAFPLSSPSPSAILRAPLQWRPYVLSSAALLSSLLLPGLVSPGFSIYPPLIFLHAFLVIAFAIFSLVFCAQFVGGVCVLGFLGALGGWGRSYVAAGEAVASREAEFLPAGSDFDGIWREFDAVKRRFLAIPDALKDMPKMNPRGKLECC